MRIERLDHLVLTVHDLDRTCAFYREVLGMQVVHTGDRTALHWGMQKINLHRSGHEFLPKAHRPTPGSADLCFITDIPLPEVMAHLARYNVPILEGPVERQGAQSFLLSVYVRDPDQNLLEISNEHAG